MPETPAPLDPPPHTAPTGANTDRATRFALSEDWIATIVGLAVVALTAAGVITEGWLPL